MERGARDNKGAEMRGYNEGTKEGACNRKTMKLFNAYLPEAVPRRVPFRETRINYCFGAQQGGRRPRCLSFHVAPAAPVAHDIIPNIIFEAITVFADQTEGLVLSPP